MGKIDNSATNWHYEEVVDEYRELVKQYAGQIAIGLSALGYEFELTSIVNTAHALAKAVLESLDKGE